MELILYNGQIRTPDGYSEAVAINGGSIAALGGDGEILALAGNETVKIDLGGRLALPGFNDSHMHFLKMGHNFQALDLSKCGSAEEMISLCREFIRENGIPPGEWVEGYGWNEEKWEEKRFPDRSDLDRISTEHPILFTRVCIHVNALNSKGLEKLRFNVESDGILKDMAEWIYESMPGPGVESIKKKLLLAAAAAVKKGITSVQTDDFKSIPGGCFTDIIRAYRELAEAGALPVRVTQQNALPDMEKYKRFIAQGFHTGQGGDFFRLGPLKLIYDGSLGARTALLAEPYSDAPNTRGLRLYERAEEFYGLVEEAHRNGMAAIIHCIGDEAARVAVTAISRAKEKYPDIKNRHGIVHAQILNETLMEQIRELDIIAYLQPVFIEADMHIAEKRVGAKRLRTSYNWRSLADTGIRIAIGTDCPVEDYDPLANIYCAVTRKDLSGYPPGGWIKEQAMTVEEAVDAYTKAGAYASYEEGRKGEIAPDMLADIVVLDRNIFNIKPDEIINTEVYMTIVDGRVVYRKE